MRRLLGWVMILIPVTVFVLAMGAHYGWVDTVGILTTSTIGAGLLVGGIMLAMG